MNSSEKFFIKKDESVEPLFSKVNDNIEGDHANSFALTKDSVLLLRQILDDEFAKHPSPTREIEYYSKMVDKWDAEHAKQYFEGSTIKEWRDDPALYTSVLRRIDELKSELLPD